MGGGDEEMCLLERGEGRDDAGGGEVGIPKEGRWKERRRIVSTMSTRSNEVASVRLRRSLVRRRDLLMGKEGFAGIPRLIDPSRELRVSEGMRTRRRKRERSSARRRMLRREAVGKLVGEGRRMD